MASAAASAEQAATASQNIRTGGGGSQAEAAAMGGFIQRFAAGGFAQTGTDSIPAMLSNREFVVNARQAERFHPQLVALNSGIAPNFAQGGNVTNNTGINGDVTVNVSGGAGRLNVKQIGDELNRLIRRGATSLRN
jgi:hypothetical protein